VTRNRILRHAAGLVLGGGAGFLVGRWVSCHSGG
jgi:hypothetical protein